MYKVKITLLALMEDGSSGNISQGECIIYTDVELKEIDSAIDNTLKDEGYCCRIQSVERINGAILKSQQ